MASAIRQGMLGDELPSADQLMSRASQLLSNLSESVGIVISPNPANEIIKHIEFVRLSDGRILVIVATRTGLVQDRLVRVNESFTQDELDRTARYVNSNYRDLTLIGIREELLNRLNEEKALYDRLLQNAILLCEKGLSETPDASPEVFVEGASNMINKTDFADTERMRELFRIFEEKSRLVKILNECVSPSGSSSVGVRIGAENNLAGLRGCAVITSFYSYGDEIVGSLGVVGLLLAGTALGAGCARHAETEKLSRPVRDAIDQANMEALAAREGLARLVEALKTNPKHAGALFGRGMAKIARQDAVGGNADIEAAKAIRPNIAEIFAKSGLSADILAKNPPAPAPVQTQQTQPPAQPPVQKTE
jgi:hypothetical protein